MKRFFHIALVIVLLVSLVGVTVSRHFCGEILAVVAIGTEAEACCDSSEMPEGCACESQTETLAIEDDFQLEQHTLKLDKVTLAVLSQFIDFIELDSFVESDSGPLFRAYKSPPAAEPAAIYVQVQSFLL